MTLNNPKPVILHPEEPWWTQTGRCWYRAHDGRGVEHIEAMPKWAGGGVAWWTPGFSMRIETAHDFHRALALALDTGSDEREGILQRAWCLAEAL